MTKQSTIRTVVSSVLGSALEFYDFTLCGVFIPVLSAVFFPKHIENVAFLGGIFAFSAAFWTRPLGAILFGYLGDKYGRKNVLSATIFLMGVPTVVIGLLPGYEQIGMAAPIILLMVRMLQGLCAGGEYNGAAIFSLEHSKRKPGLTSGLIASSCVLGVVVGVIVGYFVAPLPVEWGYWRYPFIAGGIISLVGLYIRKKTHESQDFIQSSSNKEDRSLKDVRKELSIAILAGAYNGVITYTLFGFLTVYIQKYVGMSLIQGIFANIFGIVSFMLGCIVFGAWSDRFPIKKFMYVPGVATLFLFPMVFAFFQTKSLSYLICGQIFLGLLVGSFVGPSHAFLQVLFPVRKRYKGVAIGFSTGMALTGGTTAIILSLLLQKYQDLLIPVYYGVFWAVLWLVGLFLFNKFGLKNKDELMQPHPFPPAVV